MTEDQSATIIALLTRAVAALERAYPAPPWTPLNKYMPTHPVTIGWPLAPPAYAHETVHRSGYRHTDPKALPQGTSA